MELEPGESLESRMSVTVVRICTGVGAETAHRGSHRRRRVRGARPHLRRRGGRPSAEPHAHSLGLTRFVSVDRIDLDLTRGDRLLLCSDGLNSMVPADGIAKALTNGTADEAAWKLVEAANQAGGHDNISVIVIDVVS